MYNPDDTGLGQVTDTAECCAAMQKDPDREEKCPYFDPWASLIFSLPSPAEEGSDWVVCDGALVFSQG